MNIPFKWDLILGLHGPFGNVGVGSLDCSFLCGGPKAFEREGNSCLILGLYGEKIRIMENKMETIIMDYI